MAKKLMLIGKSGSGKTTLVNALRENKAYGDKTQAICFYDAFIDTPGEYLELRSMYNALIVTSAEADVIALMQACRDDEMRLPPMFSSVFQREMIGIVSKTDLAENPGDISWIRDMLANAGVYRIFEISAYTGQGLSELMDFLEG